MAGIFESVPQAAERSKLGALIFMLVTPLHVLMEPCPQLSATCANNNQIDTATIVPKAHQA